MAQPRRMAVDGARQRELIVDAAEALLADSGGETFSARSVTSRAGLKSQLLYYYFNTMDDLILAVMRRIEARRLARLDAALAAPDPLRALWEMDSDPTVTSLSTRILALAGRNSAVRDEIIRSARKVRALQTDALSRLLAERGVDLARFPPAGVAFAISALARTMEAEAAFGLDDGHAEATAMIERLIAALAPVPGGTL